MKYYTDRITFLQKDEVFVFGSNKSGFHGAGSAGYASFNTIENVWRREKYDEKPHGWIGKWNVKGCAEGFQKGEIGRSYAIPTVTKPGAARSISIRDISISIKSFYAFALSIPRVKFLVAQDARMGFNGYTGEEMAGAYCCMDIPENVYFYKPFFDIVQAVVGEK